MRLKSYAIDVWTSVYLKGSATELQVQGLKLAWNYVARDTDLSRNRDEWSFHDFRARKWQGIHSEENRRTLKNAYRVLPKRARQRMAIFIPLDSDEDQALSPVCYNQIFTHLRGLRMIELS